MCLLTTPKPLVHIERGLSHLRFPSLPHPSAPCPYTKTLIPNHKVQLQITKLAPKQIQTSEIQNPELRNTQNPPTYRFGAGQTMDATSMLKVKHINT